MHQAPNPTLEEAYDLVKKCLKIGFFSQDPAQRNLWLEQAPKVLGEKILGAERIPNSPSWWGYTLLDTPWRHHGLGVLQREISDTQRIHVWSPILATLQGARRCHDHRFDLHSVVLLGDIFDTSVSVRPTFDPSRYAQPMYGIDHAKIQVPGQPHAEFLGYVETSPKLPQEGVGLGSTFFDYAHAGARRYGHGTSYTLSRGAFHTSHVRDLTITLVTRSNFSDEPARVLGSGESGIVPRTSKALVDNLLEQARTAFVRAMG